MTDTIDVNGSYVVAAGQDLSFIDQPGFVLLEGGDGPSLVIAGSASISGAGGEDGILYGATTDLADDTGGGASVAIQASGALTVRSSDQAVGVNLAFADSSFDNAGRLTVSGDLAATGVAASLNAGAQLTNVGQVVVTGLGESNGVTLGEGGRFDNQANLLVDGSVGGVGVLGAGVTCEVVNSGHIRISSDYSAFGVEVGAGSSLTNTGLITVRGVDWATGVSIDEASAEIDNQGKIIVTASADDAVSIGLSLQAPVDDVTAHIVNGGQIRADLAIDFFDVADAPRAADIDNSGKIDGAIQLGFGDDHVTNTGKISGAINLGGGDDVYDGSHGVTHGLLSGEAGDDVLTGGRGQDFLIGGDGADTLTGGAGPDYFIFATLADSRPSAPDLITDLKKADIVDLSGIDADTTQAGNQFFHVVTALDGHAGEVAMVYKAATDTTRLMGDVDGDGRADLVVVVAGDHADFTHFVL